MAKTTSILNSFSISSIADPFNIAFSISSIFLKKTSLNSLAWIKFWGVNLAYLISINSSFKLSSLLDINSSSLIFEVSRLYATVKSKYSISNSFVSIE